MATLDLWWWPIPDLEPGMHLTLLELVDVERRLGRFSDLLKDSIEGGALVAVPTQHGGVAVDETWAATGVSIVKEPFSPLRL